MLLTFALAILLPLLCAPHCAFGHPAPAPASARVGARLICEMFQPALSIGAELAHAPRLSPISRLEIVPANILAAVLLALTIWPGRPRSTPGAPQVAIAPPTPPPRRSSDT